MPHSNSRFFPSGEEITGDQPTLFAIMDRWRMQGVQYPYQLWEESAGFGLTFKENSKLFTQLFGHKVATISEMEKGPGEDVGGYHFYCFKTNPFIQDTLMITDGSMDSPEGQSESNNIIIGWGFHESRYYPQAISDAMYHTYFHCKQEGQKIADRLGKPLIEIMHRDTERELKYSKENHYGKDPILHPGPYVPIYMRPYTEEQKEQIKKEKAEEEARQRNNFF